MPSDSNDLLLLGQMKSPKVSGPNSISINLLTKFSDLLRKAYFRIKIRKHRVCPIYKKDDRIKCENYRPISLLSNISKLFDKVMYAQIIEFLKS